MVFRPAPNLKRSHEDGDHGNSNEMLLPFSDGTTSDSVTGNDVSLEERTDRSTPCAASLAVPVAEVAEEIVVAVV